MSAARPLDGKVVLVTGAGRGLGRATALRCGRAGATLALAGRTTAELDDVAATLEAEAGVPAIVVPTDVRDADATRDMVTRVLDDLGRVDVLVANSGIGGPTAPIWEVSPEDWDETYAVNVRGVFLCCRAVLPFMVARRSGSIVVVGSMSGKRPLLNRSAYTSSKLALVGLTRTVALETGEHGVRANLVSPGPVAGPRLDAVLRAQAQAFDRPEAELRAEFQAVSPLRRFVEPEQVAAAVVFLASDEAGGITGEDLNVSAGATMY